MLCAAVVAAPLAAQTRIPPSDPANPAAPAAALRYESAFAKYQSYRDPELADWRALNDEVRDAGGHIGIFRGAGHAGHGSAKPASKPELPAAAAARGAPADQATPATKTAPKSPAPAAARGAPGDHAGHR